MNNSVELLTIDQLLTHTIPTRLEYIPRQSLVCAILDRQQIIVALLVVSLDQLADPTTRHATTDAMTRDLTARHGASLILATYTDTDPAEHRASVDAVRATLTEHADHAATYYVHQGHIIDDDGHHSRPAPFDPIHAARPYSLPSEDDLATATLASTTTSPEDALAAYLTLTNAAIDGTYPDVANPHTIGAATALFTSLTGRDAALIALANPDAARDLITHPDKPMTNAIAHIVGPEATAPHTAHVRAWAVALWDLHAHATDPTHAALALGVLACLAFWADHQPAARTLAFEAVTTGGVENRAARLGHLIIAATQAGMRPGWAQ